MSDARRTIPSVERLLGNPAMAALLEREPRERVVDMLRAIQDEMRTRADPVQTAAEWYVAAVEQRLVRAAQPSLLPVINATGVVLHTNLGRAPLSPAALSAITAVAAGYNNLEYDVAAGTRGSRYTHCADLLCALTGAEAALVVNNNAAALVLACNTFALARPVVISRGELVEIGDSFRIAEIVARSGALVREVGATNRTHLQDYAAAMFGAAAVLKVHPSNYQTSGFVASVSIAELAELTAPAHVPLIYDLGSGLLHDAAALGLPAEPTPAEALAAGADVVTMSGDKLLGGPQAGIVLGRADHIAAMKRNPLCRALRVDKLTLAALEATLQLYAQGSAASQVPALRMISATADELRERAQRFAALLTSRGVAARVVPGLSAIGGGAYPTVELPTSLVELSHVQSARELEEKLRLGNPPVVARVVADHVVLDLRTVFPEQETVLADCVLNAG